MSERDKWETNGQSRGHTDRDLNNKLMAAASLSPAKRGRETPKRDMSSSFHCPYLLLDPIHGAPFLFLFLSLFLSFSPSIFFIPNPISCPPSVRLAQL